MGRNPQDDSSVSSSDDNLFPNDPRDTAHASVPVRQEDTVNFAGLNLQPYDSDESSVCYNPICIANV